MTVWIDGFAFDNATSYDQASSYATVDVVKSQSSIQSIDRFTGSGAPFGIAVQIKGENARRLIEQLNGIADRRGILIIRSDRQRVWGNEYEIFVAVKSFSVNENGPFHYSGVITGEFQGTPRTMYGTYRVASVQLANDFNLEGRTIIPLPDGVTGVSHLATLREGHYAIVAHADWDGAGYSAGASTRQKVTYFVDPLLYHEDAVKVYDGTTRITGTTFSREGNITIENGFTRLVIDFTARTIAYWFKVAGVFVLKETFTLQAFNQLRFIFNENDYVAAQFDTGEVLELWRGKDPIISNTVAGSFKWVTAAGTVAATAGSTNYLQIAATGVYIASQRHFQLTAGKVIQQTGTPLDGRFLITATAESIANRAKEVLKRQA